MPRLSRLPPDELAWANTQYASIDFLPSSAADFIAVAELDGVRAALGRVVPLGPSVGELGGMYVLPAFRGRALAGQLVDFLIAHGGCDTLFCLPFTALQGLYERHGFTPVPSTEPVPDAVARKHQWCLRHYSQPVALLHRRSRA